MDDINPNISSSAMRKLAKVSKTPVGMVLLITHYNCANSGRYTLIQSAVTSVSLTCSLNVSGKVKQGHHAERRVLLAQVTTRVLVTLSDHAQHR